MSYVQPVGINIAVLCQTRDLLVCLISSVGCIKLSLCQLSKHVSFPVQKYLIRLSVTLSASEFM